MMGLTSTFKVERRPQPYTEPLATNLIFTALCVCVPLSFVMPGVWKTPALQDVLIMTTISLGGLGLLWALDRACELTSANTLAAFISIQVVCEMLLTMLIGSSGASKALLAGCVLILGVAILGLFTGLGIKSHRSMSPVEQAKSPHG